MVRKFRTILAKTSDQEEAKIGAGTKQDDHNEDLGGLE